MRARGLAARRWSYRRGQSAVLVLLAALVVAACASGPLYDRAVEQATVRSTLGTADHVSRGIKIVTNGIVPVSRVAPRGAVRSLFSQVVSGGDLTGALPLPSNPRYQARVAYRDNVCGHLVLTTGRCFRADGEVVASASTARLAHLHVGQQVKVTYANRTIEEPLTIVGLYRPFTGGDDYWFDTHYATAAGVTIDPPSFDDPGGSFLDALFTTDSEITSVANRIEIDQSDVPLQASIDLAVDARRVGVDDVPTLRAELARLSSHSLLDPIQTPGAGGGLQTGLPALLDRIDSGRDDARRSILALGVQLALLAALCFLVVVLAAADQRRPELALARLRGQGVRRTAFVFTRELTGLVVLGVVPGALVAYGLTALACRLWLVSGVHAEVTAGGGLAVLAAVVLLVVLTTAVGLRTSRRPVSELLREVAPPRGSRGIGVLEAAVFVAALAGLVTTVRGGDTSALSTLTPTFVAVLAGLVLSRLLVLAGRSVGRRALRRGRLVLALAGTGLARRAGGRLTATVLCVATALVVFAGQQWSVAASNRAQRAAATTGAAVSLDVATPTMPVLVDVVHRVDPDGTWATALATVSPPNADAVPLLAVDPASFGRVASWGRASVHPAQATLDRLRPTPKAPTIEVHASTLHVTLSSARVQALQPPDPGIRVAAILRVLLRFPTGSAGYTEVGRIPAASSAPVSLSTAVRCQSGCSIAGFDIERIIPDSTPVRVRFVVSALRGDSTPLAVGTAAQWQTTTTPLAVTGLPVKDSMTATDTPAGLRFDAVDDGNFASMQHLDYPVALPALVAGATPDSRDELGYTTAIGLDGLETRVAVDGTLPFAPGLGPSALFVDLDLAIRTSRFIDALTTPGILLRTADPAREKRLVTVLKAAGVRVEARRTSAHLRAQYAASAPGWSSRYTVVVAGIAELLGVALLVLVLVTSRRTREQDLAALRLNGVPPRRLNTATVTELVAVVVAGVAGGTAAGVLAAHLVLHRLPVFAAPPDVPLPSAFPLQPLWLAGGVVTSVVVLLAAAVAMALLLVRRAVPERFAGSTVGA